MTAMVTTVDTIRMVRLTGAMADMVVATAASPDTGVDTVGMAPNAQAPTLSRNWKSIFMAALVVILI